MKKEVEELIEKCLRTAPPYELNHGFSARVLKTIRRKERRNQQKLFIFVTIGFLCMLLTGFGLISLSYPTLLSGEGVSDLFIQFNKIVPFAIILGLLIAGVQYLDKKLVKEKYLFNINQQDIN
ncbi:MAG: hypothetical protein GDA51_10895 [Ekhidna sp.]|nr:hypothetical protein [Ekhidna sp.]